MQVCKLSTEYRLITSKRDTIYHLANFLGHWQDCEDWVRLRRGRPDSQLQAHSREQRGWWRHFCNVSRITNPPSSSLFPPADPRDVASYDPWLRLCPFFLLWVRLVSLSAHFLLLSATVGQDTLSLGRQERDPDTSHAFLSSLFLNDREQSTVTSNPASDINDGLYNGQRPIVFSKWAMRTYSALPFFTKHEFKENLTKILFLAFPSSRQEPTWWPTLPRPQGWGWGWSGGWAATLRTWWGSAKTSSSGLRLTKTPPLACLPVSWRPGRITGSCWIWLTSRAAPSTNSSSRPSTWRAPPGRLSLTSR